MNTRYSYTKITGFTIVELVVVIAVIGLLATIGTISYRSMQDKTNFSILNNDLKSMKAGIERYYAKNGSYPSTADVWKFRARDGNEFIPGLYPNFHSSPLPDVMTGSKTTNTQNTYAYRSNGAYYRLIRFAPIPASELSLVPSELISPSCSTDRWGYWKNTASSCNVAP
jgi:prepilin-type N-terminal cleavage/methylation domain-containing protein